MVDTLIKINRVIDRYVKLGNEFDTVYEVCDYMRDLRQSSPDEFRAIELELEAMDILWYDLY